MLRGLPVYAGIVNESDSLQIGKYELLFSSPQAVGKPRHVRVAPRRLVQHPVEGSTTSMLSSGAACKLNLTSDLREVMEEFERRIARGARLSDFGAQLLSSLLVALHADKGIIGLLDPETPEEYQEVAVANLGHNDIIEVSDEKFAQHLIAGQVIQEPGVVMVPLYNQERVNAFLCLQRRDGGSFSAIHDISFLRNLGHAVGSSSASSQNAAQLPPLDEKIEWPVGIIGKSEVIGDLRKQVALAARTDVNVLISGETGSGKELVARAIHDQSAQSNGPFIARNCSQLPESLAEAEMFGYAPKSGIAESDPKGRPGWFELAHGGTLFLDEVHSLGPSMQDKFLRVLQDRELWRLGATTPMRVKVKIVAATDQNLETAIETKKLRAPFYYRFGMKIHVPPLRHRKEDIPLLVFHFLDKYARSWNCHTRTVSHRALQRLIQHAWPGNVRELENLIQQAVSKNHDILFSWDLSTAFQGRAVLHRDVAEEESERMIKGTTDEKDFSTSPKRMDEIEKEKIQEALEATRGNITRAGQILGYKSRQTMLHKMDRYGIPRDYADPSTM
jgi:transcriptional regulator with PAS, ATPase and Fis domain